MRRNWYDIKAVAGEQTATISIYDEIGMWGVTAKDFIASLATVEAKSLNLEINSPGGSVFDALAIFNALKTSGKDITVKVMGIAASAASYIAMVGNKIVMPENSFMMIHNPLNGIYGNAADMREMADILDKIGNSLTATYVARTGQSDAEVRALLAKDSYLSAAECLALGFADEVVPSITATASFERQHLPEHIQALFNPVADGGDQPEDPDADVAPQAEEPAVPYAEQVAAMAAAQNFGEFAAVLAVDPKLDTLDKVQARLAEIREISALCAVAKRPADAAAFINRGATLADARTALCDVLAVSNDVDTTHLSSDKPIHGVQPSAVKTADIWAARRSQNWSKK